MVREAQLVEVGPRDGFQSVGPIIPTDTKVSVLQGLYDAGVRRMETTSFVGTEAVPQLADAAAIVAATGSMEGLDAQVLVPTARHTRRALDAGARHIAFVLSVSEQHNRSNVRRSPDESLDEYRRVIALLPTGTDVRVNLATSFHCPYQGRIEEERTLAMVEALAAIFPLAEFALCDTTGQVTPDHVGSLFNAAARRFPKVQRWAFHAHDTFGLGAANALAAWDAGVRVFDASVAGLGGCPFAPGATGNVATEDLVWMFERMGVATGVDLDLLIAVAHRVAALPGAKGGGRVRDAVTASSRFAATMAAGPA